MFSACVLEFTDIIMLVDSDHITSHITSVLGKNIYIYIYIFYILVLLKNKIK